MRPDFRQVEGVVGCGVGIALGHDLDADALAREFAFFDRLEKIALMAFAVAADNFHRFLIGEAGDAAPFKGEFDANQRVRSN